MRVPAEGYKLHYSSDVEMGISIQNYSFNSKDVGEKFHSSCWLFSKSGKLLAIAHY